MTTTRIQPHHPLPAPVVHAGISQSKSHVLAGVQDAYWSDDESEDAECPLCLEEMDISDLNFKPCVCGYQICRFCWHHIKENLNKRCPACRRMYTDEAVEFKPINTEDHKRLTQQKKQRDRERKELDALGRRHLVNVRVVQRNVVYVVGIGPRFAKEELIPTLRSEDYFGKYGRITKILLVKRTPPGGREPVVGLYITYYRREDAARAIAAVDGAASPSGGREIMRASYGTTKYCMAFLRGVSCHDHNCMGLHDWGDDKDCFTKEDLTTLKHTIKVTESRSRVTASAGKKHEEQDGLPRAASWATQRGAGTSSQFSSGSGHVSSTSRQARRGPIRAARGSPVVSQAITSDARSSVHKIQEKKISVSTVAKSSSPASSSRPPTPASTISIQRPGTPLDVRALRGRKDTPSPSRSPAPSTAAGSDHDPIPREYSSGLSSTDVNKSSVPSTPALPPGLPIVPPGLSAPPGIPTPSRPPRIESASPQTPLLSSQTTYQMSHAARALIDDVKARREAVPLSNVNPSPFPDFDRTLQTLSRGDDGGFSFNLDPKLASEGKGLDEQLSIFDTDNLSLPGSFMDSMATFRPPLQHHSASIPSTGLPYPHFQNHSMFDSLNVVRPPLSSAERQPSSASSYVGSFNPFSDSNDDTTASMHQSSQRTIIDDDTGRRVSRFGFARGRQGSSNTSSPLHTSSPMSVGNSDSHSLFTAGDLVQQRSQSTRQELSYSHPSSTVSSPLVQFAQPQGAPPPQPQSRFQPFDASTVNTSLSEAQLREFIQSSRERANNVEQRSATKPDQANSVRLPFNDPAIMSASLAASPTPPENGYVSMAYAPPPGLGYPPGLPHTTGFSTAYSNDGTSNLGVRGSID
ncbi:hypothetical protein AMATHDRAFT_176752, partial [Amanita thiersii Skay4041]